MVSIIQMMGRMFVERVECLVDNFGVSESTEDWSSITVASVSGGSQSLDSTESG